MTQSLRPRGIVKLSQTVHQHLGMYALAASAAGASVLVLAQPAEARVIYKRAHEVIPLNSPFYLDLNQDGTNDFQFFYRHSSGTSSVFDRLVVGGSNQNEVWEVTSGGHRCAAKLVAGRRVGPGKPLQTGALVMFAVYASGGGHDGYYGPWFKLGKGSYLGLKFAIKGKTHYGWARLGSFSGAIVLTGYAYETIPNKPIIAGGTKGRDVIRLRDASLGDLAGGAASIQTWRVKQTAVTTH